MMKSNASSVQRILEFKYRELQDFQANWQPYLRWHGQSSHNTLFSDRSGIMIRATMASDAKLMNNSNVRHDAAQKTNRLNAHLVTSQSPACKPLRVGLVHDWLTGLRGGEKCLERLCLMFPESTIFTLIHAKGRVGTIIGGMKIKTSPLQRIPGVTKIDRHLLPIMPWAVRRLKIENVDVVISLSHCVAKAVQVPEGVPHISYCFTPMRYAWDGRASYLEKWPVGSLKRRFLEQILDRLARWDARTASGVTQFVAISDTIKARILRNYSRTSVVIAPPVDTDYYQPDTSVQREDFYLAASALVPYKLIDQAVEACNRLGKKLVVIGSGPELENLRKLAGPTVQVLGFQPDEVLRHHLRRCQALIFPGDEDFGILPIEALACGTPVIALGRGGVAETVDDSVGRLYHEPSVESLCQAIVDWEAMPQNPQLAKIARHKAERFAVDQFDQAILSLIKSFQSVRNSAETLSNIKVKAG